MSIFAPDPKQEANWSWAWALVDMPFAIPNVRIENPEATAHTRIGWFRSVYNIPHAFAVQSFAAELAAAAGRDPKEYLLELIGAAAAGRYPRRSPSSGTTARIRSSICSTPGACARVIETVAEAASWGRALPKGRGLGIAAHRSFVTYVAAVVEVEVGDDGALTIPRVDIAVDCGPQINPDRIRSQMEGAVRHGRQPRDAWARSPSRTAATSRPTSTASR